MSNQNIRGDTYRNGLFLQFSIQFVRETLCFCLQKIQEIYLAYLISYLGIAVVVLSGLYVTGLVDVVLHGSLSRGQLLSNAIFHRVREVVTD